MTTTDAHDRFRLTLLTVVGTAYTAAGYALDDRPTQWAGGLFRFLKPFETGAYSGMMGTLEYQHLYYPENDIGRFRISIARGALPGHTLPVGMQPVRRILTGLLWGDFGVRILPDPEYWWSYDGMTELGAALAESGQLTIAYAMPWLSGELESPRG
ncbi:MAG: hypothetical protein SGJ24_03975 [Chloroflexota bacterium]|nr:hypothetical protein [Chloroflexota bacterium]